jgi:predicted phage terminase large subunit-like protein
MPLRPEQLAAVTATPLTLAKYAHSKITAEQYNPHLWLRYLEQEVLTMFTRPGVEILVVSVPPQEGKTTYFGLYLPAWYLGRHPGHQIILVSYNETQAGKWGLRTRDLLKRFGPDLFDIKINPTSDSATDWKLTNGFGGMMCAGIRGGITGNPGHLMLLDDTLKGSEEANSPTIKTKNIEEWDDSITTRFQENTKVIITATRWAEDDLSGHLIERAAAPGYDGFPITVVNIKALAEPDPDELKEMSEAELAEWTDLLGRKYGEGLNGQHSQRFFEIKKKSTPVGRWMALHQGTPTAVEGGMFPEADWRYWVHEGEDKVDETDIVLPREMGASVRVWDMASSEGDGDFTVGTKVARDQVSRFFVLDRERFRHAPGGVRRKVVEAAQRDTYETVIRIEQERSGAGVTVVDDYKRDKDLLGYNVDGCKAEQDKESRATPYSNLQNKNLVFLPRHATWVKEWIKEHSQMDGKGKRPKHDDQIDTAAYAIRHLLDYGGSEIWDGTTLPQDFSQLSAEEQLELLAIREYLGLG